MDALTKLLAEIAQQPPVPGKPLTRAQSVAMAEEVDRVLGQFPPQEREDFVRRVLLRLNTGDAAYEQVVLAHALSLRIASLVRFVTGLVTSPA